MLTAKRCRPRLSLTISYIAAHSSFCLAVTSGSKLSRQVYENRPRSPISSVAFMDMRECQYMSLNEVVPVFIISSAATLVALNTKGLSRWDSMPQM